MPFIYILRERRFINSNHFKSFTLQSSLKIISKYSQMIPLAKMLYSVLGRDHSWIFIGHVKIIFLGYSKNSKAFFTQYSYDRKIRLALILLKPIRLLSGTPCRCSRERVDVSLLEVAVGKGSISNYNL